MRLMAFADMVKGGVLYIYPSVIPSFIGCPAFVGAGRLGSK